ncbi:hypothetical protein [Vagococcus sp. WN89Y]|uniref:hypothetical protein n=1 Tax=Vagococcus sp. WN89Y TaxID=3457258 RepID=UPI003FCE5F1E
MKKSCQVYNLLFCKGEALTSCTISEPQTAICTILVIAFGAQARFGWFCSYLAQKTRRKQSLINSFVM